MTESERERDYYRQQYAEVGKKVMLLQQELRDARRDARRTRLTSALIRDVYQLANSSVPFKEIGQGILKIIVGMLSVDRVAILKYLPDPKAFMISHALGFSPPPAARFSPPTLPDDFHFANSRSVSTPVVDFLRQIIGAPYLLWAFDLQEEFAMVVANEIEDHHTHYPFEEKDREVIEGALKVFLQVRKRRQAEEAIKESERQLANIINFLPDPTFVIDRDGIVIAWNQAMERLTMVEEKDILGKGKYEYALPFYNERVPLLIDLVLLPWEDVKKSYSEVKREGEMLVKENYFPRIREGCFLFGTATALYNSRGEVVGAIESMRDITERVKASEKLEQEIVERKLAENELYALNLELEKRVTKRTAELTQANAEIRSLNEQLKDENLRMHMEMQVAHRIQTSLLPPNVNALHPDFEIAAAMLPAEEVGGDYYDITLDRENTLWLGIGDVSGHGVTPGLIMMMAQTVHTSIIRNYHVSPREVVVAINRVLHHNVYNRLQEEHFMTFTALKYLGKGRFQHAGAHLDLVVYRQHTQVCELIETNGIWLNLLPDISHVTENTEFTLGIGDILVLYTDGLIEARNHEKEMLDMQRFMEIVNIHADKDVEALRDVIMDTVLEWCGHVRDDDISLIVIRRIK